MKAVQVPISMEYLQRMMTVGESFCATCVDGLPHGAVFESSYYSAGERIVYLVFSHPSFTEIPIGALLPVLWPTMRNIDVPPDRN